MVVLVTLVVLALVTKVLAADLPGKIAFVRDGNIWLAKPDGSELEQLTKAGNNSKPCFSPDGKKVAYLNESLDMEKISDAIWEMDLATRKARKVISGGMIMTCCYTAPNRIAYLEPGHGIIWDAVLKEVDASGKSKIIAKNIIFSQRLQYDIGRKIFYYGACDEQHELICCYLLSIKNSRCVSDEKTFLMDYGGGHHIERIVSDSSPCISADGRTLYFVNHYKPNLGDDVITRLMSMDTKGNSRRVIYQDKSYQGTGEEEGVVVTEKGPYGELDNPAVSPDGKWLIYEERFRLWLVSTDGKSKPRQILKKAYQPAWLPN